ncbi:MAG: hypothetical protein GJ680_20435 [Alteromonadaceae bacterium]|nr:hypothetical protein [Alteromonadaceae bacterium]
MNNQIDLFNTISLDIPANWTADTSDLNQSNIAIADTEWMLDVRIMKLPAKSEKQQRDMITAAMQNAEQQNPQGLYWAKELIQNEEEGEAIELHRWLVAVTGKSQLNMLVFDFVLKKTEANSESAQETLQQLERMLESAKAIAA